MGCCQKKKINKESINDELYNENLIPDNITISDSPSNIPSTRISLDASSTSLDDFKKLEVIGQGSFGKVFLVKNINNNKIYAMKVLEKKFLIQKKQISHTKTERIALEKLKHPFIVKLNYAFQDITNVYFVTEFLSGGELFFHLRKKAGFKEKDVKFYMSQVLLALEFMHNNNYIYRDLKPENIMIDNEGNIKLTDFGLSKIVKPNETTFTLCGTAEYLAPEILFGQGYDKTCDWFSFGVVIFEMFCGYHPFRSKTKKIDPSIYLRKTYIPDKVGKNAKDLIEKLFVSDPKKRLGYNSADEVKNHPFFKDIDFDKVLNKEYKPPFIPKLDSETDLKYFDRNIKGLKIGVNEEKKENEKDEFHFEGFSYEQKDEQQNGEDQI
jgi:serine/threonine protein kinase